MSKLIYFILIVVLISCSSSDRINVSKYNFQDQGELLDLNYLLFEFDKIMIPTDRIGKTPKELPFKVYPNTRGNVYWKSNNTLIFYPYGGFKANTDYIIEFTDNLTEYMPVKSQMPSKKIYRFHTTYTDIKSVSTNWHKANENAPTFLVCDIQFNTEAIFYDVKKVSTVKINGKEFNISSARWQRSDFLKMQIAIEDVFDVEGKELSIEIPFEFEQSDGKMKTRKMNYNGKIPLLSAFGMTEIIVNNSIDQRGLLLRFNQTLNKNADLANLINVNPQIPYEIEIYGNEIYLNGIFVPETNYEVTINQSFESIFGIKLKAELKHTVFVPEMEAQIVLADPSSLYLSSRGNKQIGIKLAGVNNLQVNVFKIFENNLIRALMGYQKIDYSGKYDEETGNWYDAVNISSIGTLITERGYNTSELKSADNIKLLDFNFADATNNNGIYLLEIFDKDKPWVRQVMQVSLSDIGIIAKVSNEQIAVYANSLVNTEPISNATVKIISKNNQIAESARTDGRGIAILKNDRAKQQGFSPSIISVEHNGETNYLFIESSTLVSKSGLNVTAGTEVTDYYCFMYGERNLYRPGETLIINGIVRNKDLKLLGDLTLKLKIMNPSWQLYKEFRVKLNEQGNFEVKEELAQTLKTGNYEVLLDLPNDVNIGKYSFSIEDFAPERLKITATTDRESYTPQQDVNLNIQTDYLFGMPAQNLSGEISFETNSGDFTSEKFEDYDFTLRGAGRVNDYSFRPIVSDNAGNTKEIFKIDELYQNMGLIYLHIGINMQDETGSDNRIYLVRKIHTQNTYVGINSKMGDWFELNRPIITPIVVLDKEGEESESEINIDIFKITYSTALRSSRNYDYRYESNKIESIVSSETIKAKGQYNHKFTPVSSGEYEIRIRQNNADGYVMKRFWAYRYGYAESAGFNVDKEGKVIVSADKKDYKPGETAKLLFKTPFDGKLFVSIEREGVLEHFVLRTNDNSASLNIPIKNEYHPNVYVSAILIKSVSNNNFPLNVAYGYEELTIKDEKRYLPIEIIADETSRSTTKKKIKVKTLPEKDINVTIAVTDEGILQLKRYQSPAPYDFFYAARKLDVNTYSGYTKLYKEYKARSGQFGGDGGELAYMKMLDLQNPFVDKAVKLLSFWSGNLKTDANGMAEFEIDLPTFSGALRIMAVAYKNDRFGSAEKMMKIADPLIVTPALPRFLSIGDEAEVKINLKNLTDKKKSVKIEQKIDGDLLFEPSWKNSITLEPRADIYIAAKLKPGKFTGSHKITFNVSDGNDKYSIERLINVRIATNIELKSEFAEIKPGQTVKIKYPQGFMPNMSTSVLTISRQPYIEFFDQIDFLTDYPYGCTEQVISSVFPLLVYKDFKEYTKNSTVKLTDLGITERVNNAIKQISALQNQGGGVGLWSSGESDIWVSAYALHFLTEAKNRGYNVNEDGQKALINYLKSIFSMTESYDQSKNDLSKYNSADRYKLAAYTCFVLARAGKPEQALMNFYAESAENMPYDSKVLLASAFLLSGNIPAFYALMPNTIESSKMKDDMTDVYGSKLRELALLTYAYSTVKGNDVYTSKLANLLTSELRRNEHYTTQEAAFTLLAIANIMEKGSGESSFSFDGKNTNLNATNKFVSHKITADKEITNTGQNSIWYSLQSKGYSKEAKKSEVSSFVGVERTLYNQSGSKISANQIVRGERIFVKLSVRLKDGLKSIDNLAVSEMIPAGWVIENPRLSNTAKPSWIKNVDEPFYADYRDDRVNMFANVRGNVEFFYVARAVSAGYFKFGPLTAVGMYNPEVYFSGKSSDVKIAEKPKGGV
ncbi:MAG: hypothetical protein CVV22_07075 [Ignavibacteriae bacterium HGW-Ignavibacteriae-1]|jgi:hypothetical protein|nr:MAG: hypothetical protein CVV22_07075 [Ignavibacteriae bacterium HGW-Ignavibacteriae-1]